MVAAPSIADIPGQSGAGMVAMYCHRPQVGVSEIARAFLFRVNYLEHHAHEMRDLDAYCMWWRIREDASYLIGWMAS